jgi:stage II sporulation protein D
VQVEGRSYRGRLRLRVGEEGGLAVVNVLPSRQYLWSVVGSEMYSNWRLEALMAQAVAARTYMVYALDSKPALTLTDMAYKGVAAESSSATLAADVTDGIVLTYEGRILPAYFHSTCGGRTVPVDRVFDAHRIPPLSGVECPWCRQSPAYTWQAKVPAALLAAALSDRGVRAVRSLQPEGTTPAGYARSVTVNDRKRIDATAFRLAVGGDVIKSTRFQVERVGGEFVFAGRGYGHGVGMCQWGAHGLSEAGRSWEEILSYYYPGSRLQQIR